MIYLQGSLNLILWTILRFIKKIHQNFSVNRQESSVRVSCTNFSQKDWMSSQT